MSSGFTGEAYLTYLAPRPFVTPTLEVRANVRPVSPTDDSVSRQFIGYSATHITEIMIEIGIEYRIRKLIEPIWKLYHGSGTDDFQVFTPSREGTILRTMPVKFFPRVVRDIQDAVETLVNDSKRPDSLASHLARCFANGQGQPSRREWDNETKLKDGIQVPGTTAGGFTTLNPLTRAIAGLWPFTDEYIRSAVCKTGVTLDGIQQHNSIIDDPLFPQFSIGMPSGFGEGGVARDPSLPQDGRDGPMTPGDRPTRDARTTANTIGTLVFDKDQGYSPLGHLTHVVEMLRFQPPQIETFPTNVTPRWYTTNLVSNQTPNRAWVESQPIQQNLSGIQNWGAWHVLGFCGVVGNALHIQVKTNPTTTPDCQTECPFALFFPPPECTCTCTCGDRAVGVWHSSEFTSLGNAIFVIDELTPDAGSPIRAKAKYFNPNSILRITGTFTGGGENTKNGGRITIGVKTLNTGLIDVPFFNIYDSARDGPVSSVIEVNLMEKLVQVTTETFGDEGFYKAAKLDALMALQVECNTSSFSTTTCPSETNNQGTFCPNCLGSPCLYHTTTALVDTIELVENRLAGDPVLAYLP